MKTKAQILVVLMVAILLSSQAFAEWAHVERVVDGDTFIALTHVERVVDGETFVTSKRTRIRISEIDTPETKHPTKGVEPGGEAATELAKFFLEGKDVWLDGNATGKYGRRIAKVYLRNGKAYSDIVKAHGYDKNSKKVYAFPTKKDHYTRSASRVVGNWQKKSSSTRGGSASYTPASTSLSRSTSPSRSSSSGKKEVYVKGYYRENGTYVNSHYRSAPKKRK